MMRLFCPVAWFAMLIFPTCLLSQFRGGFPDRELEHRQTRGYDPRSENPDTGPPRTDMECRDGSSYSTYGYRPDVCEDRGGVRGWSRSSSND